MIYRVRTYVAVPENVERFNAFFRDHLLPVQRRHGARLIGRWASDDARIVAVWEYDDIDAYHRIDAAVRADPDSVAARELIRGVELYVSREDQFMHSTLSLLGR